MFTTLNNVQELIHMNDELFSYRVSRFREGRHLTREQLAQALGISARYISMIESGEKDIEPSSSLYKLFALMETNKVQMDYVQEIDHSSPRHSHAAAVADLDLPASLTVTDIIDQIKVDLSALTTSPRPRRSFLFIRDIHIPMLGRALKISANADDLTNSTDEDTK